jgi:hypothetical protein
LVGYSIKRKELKNMDLNKIRELVSKDEEELFNGFFSERTIRADLSARREKRNFYIEVMNRFIDDHMTIANAMQFQDSNIAEKSKKCKNEASRLLDIIYDY